MKRLLVFVFAVALVNISYTQQTFIGEINEGGRYIKLDKDHQNFHYYTFNTLEKKEMEVFCVSEATSKRYYTLISICLRSKYEKEFSFTTMLKNKVIASAKDGRVQFELYKNTEWHTSHYFNLEEFNKLHDTVDPGSRY